MKLPPLKRTRAKAYNPTLSSIREHPMSQEDPSDLRSSYRPYLADRKMGDRKKIYKREASFVISMTSLTLLVTDTPYICYGAEYDHIKKFKRQQEVQFPDSLVSFAYRTINKADDDLKAFLLDIPAFLHIFNKPEMLLEKMHDKATELTHQWNEDNSSPDMKGSRTADERIIALDFRQNSKSSGVSEIVLCPTTFDFTVANQNTAGEVICKLEDVMFQLMYQIPAEQTNDGKPKPKSGMIRLSYDDWKRLFEHKDLLNIYNETWERYPLPQSYSDRLEQYNYINKTE